ncbi:glucoamylase family protein [Neorhizobium sp. NPDC001467]|uniref:glucoamylase family protein n=1 Tax=Neorhizobium sp. NPDC001467 TaxID=3390595 RepID=UPI003D0255A4
MDVTDHLQRDRASLPLDALLDEVQYRTLLYFWEGAHPQTGLPFEKRGADGEMVTDAVALSGVGFGLMALLVGTERGWISRDQSLARTALIVDSLFRAPRFHGAFSHLIHGTTCDVLPFSQRDDGGDLVETTLLMQGLICAREYFAGDGEAETELRAGITRLYDETDWRWYTRGDDDGPLYWHWSDGQDWIMNLPITGWNEALCAYILAAGSNTHPIDPQNYHAGWTRHGAFVNGETYHGTRLPFGEPLGGPLFLSQYAFCALDPRGLEDRYGDYWEQAVAHARINHDYCLTVPAYRTAGVWGLTASEIPHGYAANSPTHDAGAVAPTAALSSFPFLPREAEKSLRAFMAFGNGRLFGPHGFVDAFMPAGGWTAPHCIVIDQGPIVAMIENFRTGLLWNLFMQAPEVRRGLNRLEFQVGNQHSG